MRLRIIETDFTGNKGWIFKLSNEFEHNFYIMVDTFYIKHNVKSPLTKKEPDHYASGLWINASVMQIERKDIVVGV